MKFLLGQGVASLLEKELLNAKRRIIAITPWIGEHYAKILKNKAKSIEVILVTTERTNPGLHVLEKVYIPPQTILVALVTLILSVLALQVYLPLGMSLIIMSILLLLLGKKKKIPRWVKILENLHAKIYIIDEKVYLTSANLTIAGTKKNVEFLLETDATDEILNKVKLLTKA